MAYALHGVAETLTALAPAVQAASQVAADPTLPQVVCHVTRLRAVTAGKNPGSPCPRIKLTPEQKTRGVGLYTIEPPLRAFVWARQNPIAAAAIGAGVVGLIGAIGYSLGKRSRR